MINLIVTLSKYLLLILIALYTLESFIVFGYRYEEDKRYILKKQLMLIFFMDFMAFLVIFLKKQELEIIYFFIVQLLYFIAVQILYRIFYKNSSLLLLNHTCMLLSIGFIMLARLDMESAVRQFEIVVIATIIAMVIPVMIHKFRFLNKWTWFYAVVGLLLLLTVLVLGKNVNGAKINISFGGFAFQPSEFAKVTVILFLAFIISKIQERYVEDINKPTRLLIIFVAVAIPLLLIIKQPDYGTAMAFCIALAMMLFTAGLDKKYIIGAVLIACISVPILYNFILPEHAKKRIDIFLNPESDPRGSGYNIIQSKLAIGAGQLTGMGLLKGNQTQLGYLYPKTTDFIFSVIGEEMGFIVGRYNYSTICISGHKSDLYSKDG